MPLEYKDNRRKFESIAPWESPALTPRSDNPTPAKTRRVEPAIRGTVSPRDRITELRNPPPPEPEPEVTPEPAFDAVPNPADWEI